MLTIMACKACGTFFGAPLTSDLCPTCRRALDRVFPGVEYARLRELVQADRQQNAPLTIEDLRRELAQVKRERYAFMAYLAQIFDSPCNYSPIDDTMLEFCGKCDGDSNAGCWLRVAKMVLKEYEHGQADREGDNE